MGQYIVEYTTDLTAGWTQKAGPLSSRSYSEPIPADRTGFYRIGGQ